MPKYDYACINCDVQKEVEFSIHAERRVECDKCGNAMNQVFTAPGAIFKGGGWGGQ